MNASSQPSESPEDRIAVRKVRDLDTSARQCIQNLLGRTLADDEDITILAFPEHTAPAGQQRRQSQQRMDEALAKVDERTRDVPDEELDEAAEEAMDHARRWKA